MKNEEKKSIHINTNVISFYIKKKYALDFNPKDKKEEIFYEYKN